MLNSYRLRPDYAIQTRIKVRVFIPKTNVYP